MILNVYTDGGSRGNPGPSAIGVVIKDETFKVVHKFGDFIGEYHTNNHAEYTAAITALEYLLANYKPSHVNFWLDSALVVNHVNGVYRIKSPELFLLYKKVKHLCSFLPSCSWQHIRREFNQEADEQVNLAFKRWRRAA